VFKDGLRHTVMDKRHGTASSKNSSSSSSSSAAAQVGNARYFSRAELRDLFTLGAPGETRALKQIEQRHGTLQQVGTTSCTLLTTEFQHDSVYVQYASESSRACSSAPSLHAPASRTDCARYFDYKPHVSDYI
jgi:hypothetical protein